MCTTVASVTASCQVSGFTLLFGGTTANNIGNNSVVSLGNFDLTGAGNLTVPAGSLSFTLNVNQTQPNSGVGIFLGSITGTVSSSPNNFSSLIWTPNKTVDIGPVDYLMVFDQIGPAANTGLSIPINNSRGINALVTTTATPEPGTIALVVTGLAGLIPVARRRKARAS